MSIFTRISQTLGKDVVDFCVDPNERRSDEQANEKKKLLEKSNDVVSNTNELIIEKSKVVEKRVESKEATKLVDGNTLKPDENPVVPLSEIKILPPFIQSLKKKENDTKFKKFVAKFNNLSVNIPLLEALQKMFGYAKFIEEWVIKKLVMDIETIVVTHNYSAIMSCTIVVKKDNSGAFIIPCTIGVQKF
ncbi:uncharacterized protein LOC124897854 [Capsicum annuum]|uniref:uncharacterized protein LOC124897854 n=1 Tax=Capsicum annuum TaxID=4072 RepID=UPI001FB074D2|nr:uncharacterized protein LOC124897854 [Capsicum annuum]